MKAATIRTGSGSTAALLDGDVLRPIGFGDVRAWLEAGAPAADSQADPVPVADARFAPLVSPAGKIVCVGLNYRDHILEMGRALPAHPTLFAKFGDSLVGADEPIILPRASERVDWEAELAVVVGGTVRHADAAEAEAAIAGFTVANDVSVRDFQRRTTEWLQGKTFDRTTPLGPYLTTVDEIGVEPALEVGCAVDGERMQHGDTAELVFGPVALVQYISSITTLRPGDVVLTGTPGGVGDGRDPQRYLHDGDVLTTWISSLGSTANRCVLETL